MNMSEKVKRVLRNSPLLLLGIMVVVMAAHALTAPKLPVEVPKLAPNVTSATVKITNMAGNSGGSGSVVSISETESEVLTNSHVCELLKTGGKVTTTYGETHAVKYFRQDTDHDLCLVVVPGKLKDKSVIAPTKPSLYSDAAISGHPNLLPNVVTKGHFTENQFIQVFTGIAKCTPEQQTDPELGIVCFFFGGLPVVKTYETTVVTALIMPGSSGSAVYNSAGEIGGVAFAGSAGMSYAFVVPYEYVASFLDKNLNGKNRDQFSKPDYKIDIITLLRGQSFRNKTLVKKCEDTPNNVIIEGMCRVITDTLKWRQ